MSTHQMKMAKATNADIKALQNFFSCLENAENKSDEAVARFVRMAMRGLVGSAHHRVTIGCDILIDNCCDPDLDYLEFKPEIRKLMPETENEQGEKLFYVISYTHSKRGVLMLWGKNNKGYTSNVKRAGKYTESQIRGNMAYYHQGENAVSISVAELHEKYEISENVWHSWDQRQIHMERVKLGILEELKEEMADGQAR